jgi:hypothetical protein
MARVEGLFSYLIFFAGVLHKRLSVNGENAFQGLAECLIYLSDLRKTL